MIVSKTLLIIEDDPGLQSQMRWCFNDDVEVHMASDRETAISLLRRYEPAVVTLDLGLPPDPGGSSEGFKVLEEILQLAPKTKVIVVTGREENAYAVKAVGMGATDFFQKPLDADILNFVVERAFNLAQLETENSKLKSAQSNSGIPGVIANSPSMLKVCRTLEKIAPADVSTLILGETGTGKEVLARAIHSLSPRSDAPFAAINCAAIPENLLESELFGHEKGAFTGAHQQKKGKIELAHGGTLFLDEIGDMPASLQPKMLRFLQERVIERVGGVKEIPVDVRVVCATHQDINNLISQGSFREDLYYRISEITLNIPALREREGDSVLIAQALLKSISSEMNRGDLRLSEDAMAAIRSYDWPGNVREMINKIKRAAIMADGMNVSAEDLELESSEASLPEGSLNLKQIRDQAEKTACLQAIKGSHGNMAKAARILGITRPTLYSLFEKHGIEAE
ncbi:MULTISPECIES: PEP-CTERM-box response regulator transcription factor [unclassified Oleiphilus]|nr:MULTISPECIES: PEP-CTERM-box response regulator transcription factor [unclassified Oleiphilus]KZY64386.1 sigma-54-dependent Fis family transcriptional regulator [Oleiphilus sp. HI0066]KZY76353.1 sigma-54-dependent Fis family transcriptional regulator [Oleiphilus sp. HI0067]